MYTFPLPHHSHGDIIKWNHFPRYWLFVRGIYRSPVNSPHKGQWRGTFTFYLICVWINGLVHNRECGDLRRHRTHYVVTVILPAITLAPNDAKPSAYTILTIILHVFYGICFAVGDFMSTFFHPVTSFKISAELPWYLKGYMIIACAIAVLLRCVSNNFRSIEIWLNSNAACGKHASNCRE